MLIACPFLLTEVSPVSRDGRPFRFAGRAAMDDCGSSSGLPVVVCVRSNCSRFDSGCVRRAGGSVRTNGERHGCAKQWAPARGGAWMSGLVTLFDANNPSARNDRVEFGQRVHSHRLVLPDRLLRLMACREAVDHDRASGCFAARTRPRSSRDVSGGMTSVSSSSTSRCASSPSTPRPRRIAATICSGDSATLPFSVNR